MQQFLKEVFGWPVDFLEVRGYFYTMAGPLVQSVPFTRDLMVDVLLADVDVVPGCEHDQVSVVDRFINTFIGYLLS